MPRKIIPLGSPQYEYDFSNDTSPFENGVGYAIGTWLGTADKVAQAREQKQTSDLRNQLTMAQIGAYNRKGGGKRGQRIPPHILQYLTTKLGSAKQVMGDDGKLVTTYQREQLPSDVARRNLALGGWNPDTLEEDPDVTVPELDQAPPPPATPSPVVKAEAQPGWLANLLHGGADLARQAPGAIKDALGDPPPGGFFPTAAQKDAYVNDNFGGQQAIERGAGGARAPVAAAPGAPPSRQAIFSQLYGGLPDDSVDLDKLLGDDPAAAEAELRRIPAGPRLQVIEALAKMHQALKGQP